MKSINVRESLLSNILHKKIQKCIFKGTEVRVNGVIPHTWRNSLSSNVFFFTFALNVLGLFKFCRFMQAYILVFVLVLYTF